jgi:hypothetical protein
VQHAQKVPVNLPEAKHGRAREDYLTEPLDVDKLLWRVRRFFLSAKRNIVIT